MGWMSLLAIAVALAMDAFAVALLLGGEQRDDDAWSQQGEVLHAS